MWPIALQQYLSQHLQIAHEGRPLNRPADRAPSPVAAVPALPFRIFDAHAHFVAADTARYPIRADLPDQPHEREMREHQLRTPTTAERVLREWEGAGVDGGVAVQYRSAYGLDNRYVLDTAAAHPDTVRAVVILDPQDPATPLQLRRWVEARGVCGLRIIGKSSADGTVPWLDAPAARETWAAAEALGIAMVIMTVPVYRADERALEKIGTLAERHPDLRIVLDHLGWPAAEGGPDFGFGAVHRSLASQRRIHFKFTTLNLGVLERASLPAADFLQHAVDLFGADRLMWGSDLGNNTRPYDELVRGAVAATARLQPMQRQQVLRDTARAVFRRAGSALNMAG